MANSAIERWPQGRFDLPDTPALNYDLSLLLDGMNTVWYQTANRAYYQYIKQSIDRLIASDGSIPNWDPTTNSLDNIALGRQLLLLYRVTQNAKYYKAARLLRQQKQSYPDRVRLNGLYMVEPFYAEFASVFQEPADFSDITPQFYLSEEHSSFSVRSMGWYMMALVDSLPFYPGSDPGRAALLTMLNQNAVAIVRYQDKETGLWPEALDRSEEKANPSESSATCMLVYALQKAVRLGYLPPHYSDNAARAWQEILSRFVQTDAKGNVTITGNTPMIVGAFLLASTEMELKPSAGLAQSQVVMLDAWFNSQQRSNAVGQKEYFHYKWNDYSDSGYSLFGNVFTSYGASLDTLYSAPTVEKLKRVQYYIIASPDIPVKNPHPNYVQPEDAEQVASWVAQGGFLILLENDPPNADIDHLNLIADRFGIHFNNVLGHHVIGDNFPAGQIAVTGNGAIFHAAHLLYMKDTCTISLKAPAKPLLEDKGDIVMAMAKYGKGTVFAVVDPWLYNEYTDGRKKPPQQDNYAAGKELVRWLIEERQR